MTKSYYSKGLTAMSIILQVSNRAQIETRKTKLCDSWTTKYV